jgi:hypothetical protein
MCIIDPDTLQSAAGIKIMVKQFSALVIGIALSGAASTQENLHFVGDFESGQIRSKSSTHDGFYVATLPDPQSGAETIHSPNSTFGPTTNADTRVVRSEVVGNETVTPRKGQYFIRAEVFHDKNYLDLNENVKNRPRSKIYMSDPVHQIDFDVEGYAGFSIFTPSNFESELGVKDHRGESMLFAMSSSPSRTLVTLGQWVESPANEAHWFVKYWTGANSVDENNSVMKLVDLGPVRSDAGRWTDFVFRYRYNPFSVTTNPAAAGIPNSKNQEYQGNKGILQVWKAEGAVDKDGNRGMVLKIDKVNLPVGLVPHATTKITHYWRIYKYGWLSNPTTLTHPVWFGFDEIRQGLVGRDGTGFGDVVPSGVPCTSGCTEKPNPPSDLLIN